MKLNRTDILETVLDGVARLRVAHALSFREFVAVPDAATRKLLGKARRELDHVESSVVLWRSNPAAIDEYTAQTIRRLVSPAPKAPPPWQDDD